MKGKLRKQKTTILLLCEGTSERSYGAFIQKLSDNDHKRYAFKSIICGKKGTGGGPLGSLLENAKVIIRGLNKNKRNYKHKFLILDTDLTPRGTQEFNLGVAAAKRMGIDLIWQEADHEGFLLRHFDGCGNHNKTNAQVDMEIKKHWRGYSKPLSSIELAKIIEVGHVVYAKNNVQSFGEFFEKIKWDIG